MRGRRWKYTWWVTGLIASAVTAAIALLSGSFTWSHYFDDQHLVALDAGDLEFWALTGPLAEDMRLADIFADYYSPRPWPAEGLLRKPNFSLDWSWPALARNAHSGIGEWWEIRVPLWAVLAVVAALGALRSIRTARRRRSSGIEPALTPAAYGPFGRLPWSPAGRRILVLSLVNTTLLAGLWVFSIFYWLTYSGQSSAIDIDRGSLIWRTDSDPDFEDPFRIEPGWYGGTQQPPELCWELPHTADCYVSLHAPWSEWVAPFWTLMLLSGSPALVLLWRHRRRRRPGHCRQCGYNLTGNISGRCPECGTLVASGLRA